MRNEQPRCRHGYVCFSTGQFAGIQPAETSLSGRVRIFRRSILDTQPCGCHVSVNPIREYEAELDAAVTRQLGREGLPDLWLDVEEPCLAVEPSSWETCTLPSTHRGPHSWQSLEP